MPGLLPDLDPDGLLEFSVVFTDRSLNHRSQRFQQAMREISATLEQVCNATAMALARRVPADPLRHAILAWSVVLTGYASRRWGRSDRIARRRRAAGCGVAFMRKLARAAIAPAITSWIAKTFSPVSGRTMTNVSLHAGRLRGASMSLDGTALPSAGEGTLCSQPSVVRAAEREMPDE